MFTLVMEATKAVTLYITLYIGRVAPACMLVHIYIQCLEPKYWLSVPTVQLSTIIIECYNRLYELVITPPGGIWMIYKHDPRGCEALEEAGLLISHILTGGVRIIDLLPIPRFSFGKRGHSQCIMNCCQLILQHCKLFINYQCVYLDISSAFDHSSTTNTYSWTKLSSRLWRWFSTFMSTQ